MLKDQLLCIFTQTTCLIRLRLAAGNGLQADIWEEFQARFAIPKILEFYAATEANVSLYNVEGKAGASPAKTSRPSKL